MRDDEIDSSELADDPLTTLLDRLDSAEDLGAPDEAARPSPALSRRDLDERIDRILDDELGRLNERRA